MKNTDKSNRIIKKIFFYATSIITVTAASYFFLRIKKTSNFAFRLESNYLFLKLSKICKIPKSFSHSLVHISISSPLILTLMNPKIWSCKISVSLSFVCGFGDCWSKVTEQRPPLQLSLNIRNILVFLRIFMYLYIWRRKFLRLASIL